MSEQDEATNDVFRAMETLKAAVKRCNDERGYHSAFGKMCEDFKIEVTPLTAEFRAAMQVNIDEFMRWKEQQSKVSTTNDSGE